MYKRPKPRIDKAELDKIYFISNNNNNKDDDCYDSIDVIDERRSKNFKQSGGFCRSSTVIYSEYCSGTSAIASCSIDETAPNGLKKNINNDEIHENRATTQHRNGTAADDDVASDSDKRPSSSEQTTTITVQAEIASCGMGVDDQNADGIVAADDNGGEGGVGGVGDDG